MSADRMASMRADNWVVSTAEWRASILAVLSVALMALMKADYLVDQMVVSTAESRVSTKAFVSAEWMASRKVVHWGASTVGSRVSKLAAMSAE